jgi:1-deoxy-D-xylulose 5-phosphate reductoisomerase
MRPKSEMFEGTPVKINNKTVIIPALSFGQVEDLAPKLEKISGKNPMNPEIVSASIDIVYAAISQNYKCTREEIKQMITTRNVKAIMNAIQGESGLASDEEYSDAKNAGEITPVV